jgi:hypothetical protein
MCNINLQRVSMMKQKRTQHVVFLPSSQRDPLKADLHIPCRSVKGLDCVFPALFTVRPCLIHTCHVVPLPCHEYAVLKATSQGHGRETAWYV